jgi:hypothetical protein
MEELTPFLSPKVAQIMQRFKQVGSIEALRAAEPQISDQDIAEVTAEMLRVMELFQEPPRAKGSRRKGRRKRGEAADAYQLKITLRGSKPPIWRRIVIPGEITLDLLHEVIQSTMGWFNCHLHLFDIDGKTFQAPGPDGYIDEEMSDEDATQFRFCDVAPEPRSRFRYEYDFGDDWEHIILVEKVIPAAQKPKTMVCLGGKGRCPPEDSGGIWSYYNKLRILADPSDPEHEDIKEWMEGIDPNEFDPDKVTRALADFKSS